MNYTNIDTNRTVSVNHSIDNEELKLLAAHDHFPSLTIYIPTARKGTEAKQNPVQIENAVQDAANKLVGLGMQQNFASQFVQPALDLAKDIDLMQHLYEGTVLFISLSEVKLFTLPCPFKTEIAIDNIFDLRQVMICETNNPQFYLLHITENSVSFFSGDSMELTQVSLPKEVPQSMDERFDLEERGIQTQSHPVSTDGSGGMLRGNVPLKDVEDKFIKQFVQDIEKGVMNILPANSHRPLIFAGSPSMTAMYKEVNKYKHLLDETITGNYEGNITEMHTKALDIINIWWSEQIRSVIDKYEELKGRDVTTENIPSILPAVYNGAIDTLLIAENAELKGEYELQTNKLDMSKSTDHDLVNELIVQTILQNGRIMIVPREQMPDQEDVAALLRFTVNMTAT